MVRRKDLLKRSFAGLMTAAMLLGNSAVPVLAAEPGAVTEAAEDEEFSGEEASPDGEKLYGTPVATAMLGENVLGSIYQEGGKTILYVEGEGTVLNKKYKDSELKDYKITEVTFGGNVSTIGEAVFNEVSTIKRVEISSGITEIGQIAFRKCTSLEELVFEEGGGTLEIGNRAFQECTKLKAVTLPKRTADTIGSFALAVFDGCTSLTDAAFEEGTVCVPEYAFCGVQALKNVAFPSTVTKIGDNAFNKCKNLGTVRLPEKLQSIGEGAFSTTALKQVTIPGSVTEIEQNAFRDNASLTEVTFEKGNGKLEIGNCAFKNCTKLDNVVLPARISEKAGGFTVPVFDGCTSLKTASLEDGAVCVPSSLFAGATALKNVTIPDSAKSIGSHAFRGCTGLESVELPANIQSMEECAFYECSSLKSVNIPDKVKEIPQSAFMSCSMLTEVGLPKSLEKVMAAAFDKCGRIAKVSYGGNKTKEAIKKNSGDGNDALFDIEWTMTGGEEPKPQPVTGEITMDGEKVSSLKEAFKSMKDANKDYVIELASDVTGEKNLSIPRTAKSVTINGNGYSITITGGKLISAADLVLEDVNLVAVNAKGASAKLLVNAKKNLCIEGDVNYAAVSASVKVKNELVLNSSMKANSITTKTLTLNATGELRAEAGNKITVKTLLKGNGGAIDLAPDFNKPITLGGSAEGEVRIIGGPVADGTQIFNAKAKKLPAETLKTVFDVSEITENTTDTHLYYFKGSQVCIFGESISYNGNKYGLWKDAVAAMNADKKNGATDFVVELDGDVNIKGAFALPKKGYGSITINGNGHTVTFTGDIKLTGNTVISMDTTLKKVDKKGVRQAGKIKKGKYNYEGPQITAGDE